MITLETGIKLIESNEYSIKYFGDWLESINGNSNSNFEIVNDYLIQLRDNKLYYCFVETFDDLPTDENDKMENCLYFVKSLSGEHRKGVYGWNQTNGYFEISCTITLEDITNLLEQGEYVTKTDIENNVKHTGDYTVGNTYKPNDLFKYNDDMYFTETEFIAADKPDFSKVYIIAEKKYDHFTMEIDSNINSSPSVENGGIKYSGGCEGFSQQDWVDWLGYKPCVMYGQGDIECYLDPNNYANDINGNSVDISSTVTSDGHTRNVMIKYPRIGLQSQQISIGKWIIKCTNDPCDSRYLYSAFTSGKRKFETMFIGAYNGSVSDEKLHSVSNADVVSIGQTLESYRTLAQANGSFYNILDVKKLTFLKHLYMLQNSTINGKLMSWFDTDNLQTGFYNTIGMNKNDTSTRLGKILGIETNGFSEIIEGAYVDENYRLKISDNDLYNSDGSGYVDSGAIYTLGTGYMGKNVSFDVDCGIIANSTGGTDTTLFNCQTYLVNPSSFMNVNMRNIFNYEFKFNATTSFNGTNARLCYLFV